MISTFDEFINEDQQLADISKQKAFVKKAIKHLKELIKMGNEWGKMNGYSSWDDMGNDLGYTDYVNLFDTSIPKERIKKLEKFLKASDDELEQWKSDKVLSLHRNRSKQKPHLP